MAHYALVKIQGVEGGDDAARAIAVFVWSSLPDGLREIVLAVSEKTPYGFTDALWCLLMDFTSDCGDRTVIPHP